MKYPLPTLLLLTCWTFATPSFAQDSAPHTDSQPATQPAAGIQVEQEFTTSSGAKVPYLLYLPREFKAGAKLPIMLFLHGRGESFGPLKIVAQWGPPRFAARGDSLPYIVVSPQCPQDDEWKSPTQQKRVRELLAMISKTYDADTDRVYLTGLSMGGYGSWRLAADQPGLFAAAVIICGGGDPADAEKLKDLPIWVFHGDQDTAVPIEASTEMIVAIKRAKGRSIRFTSLENIGHNSWSAAYATPEVFDWLNKHHRH